MRSSYPILGAALALTLPAALPAQNSLSDFRLQPEPTPTPSNVQGPVASDVPESRTIRSRPVVPSPSPAPTPTVPAAEPVIVPLPVLPDTSEPARSADDASPAVSTPRPATAASVPASDSAAPPAPAEPTSGSQPEFPGPATSLPTPAPLPAAAPPAVEQQGGLPWPWLAGGALALVLGGGLAWAWRRRKAPIRGAEAPPIERPRPLAKAAAPSPPPAAPRPAPAPAPVAPEPAGPLSLALQPLRLSLTLVNASLAYRLEVANRGADPLAALLIEADMISAHASLGREAQLAGPGVGAPVRHAIERLSPGESTVIEGEFRLPFAQIVPIRQGSAALLLPLARFRAAADGFPPIVRTFAVGQASANPGAGLQPFRLDQGPRIYPNLAQRAFA